ncbi:S1 RNA-binding domain-containing protein [Pantoea ananatis]
MVLEGAVTNVTNFGAFIDIGVHQDGLVHISSLSDKFVERSSPGRKSG